MRDALALMTDSGFTPAGITSRTARALMAHSTDLTELVNSHVADADEENLEAFDSLVQELFSKAPAIGVDLDADQSGIVTVEAANHAPSNDNASIGSRTHPVSSSWHHAEARSWRQKWRARRHVWHETNAQ